jgi:hypothetical protein
LWVWLGYAAYEEKEAQAIVARCKQNKMFLEKAVTVVQCLGYDPSGPRLSVCLVNEILNVVGDMIYKQ